jgi:hypothetical protein
MTPFRFFHRGRWDDERARELEAHLAIEIDGNIARGLSPRDARDAAQRKLGNTTLVREEIYQMNTGCSPTAAARPKLGAPSCGRTGLGSSPSCRSRSVSS